MLCLDDTAVIVAHVGAATVGVATVAATAVVVTVAATIASATSTPTGCMLALPPVHPSWYRFPILLLAYSS